MTTYMVVIELLYEVAICCIELGFYRKEEYVFAQGYLLVFTNQTTPDNAIVMARAILARDKER